MMAGQWLEREGRFSCSTKIKLSVADARVVRIVDRVTTRLVSISLHNTLTQYNTADLQYCVADKLLYTIGLTIIQGSNFKLSPSLGHPGSDCCHNSDFFKIPS